VVIGGGRSSDFFDEVLRCLEPISQSAHPIHFAKTPPPDSKCQRSVIVYRNRADAFGFVVVVRPGAPLILTLILPLSVLSLPLHEPVSPSGVGVRRPAGAPPGTGQASFEGRPPPLPRRAGWLRPHGPGPSRDIKVGIRPNRPGISSLFCPPERVFSGLFPVLWGPYGIPEAFSPQ